MNNVIFHKRDNSITIGDRKCGFIVSDATDKLWYVSPRIREVHYFRIWQGWAIAIEILDFLEEYGVYGVKLCIDSEGVEYATLEQIRFKGHLIQYEGFEPQIVMAERYWMKRGQMVLG